MTENNGRVWRKKVMSKKNQGLQHGRKEEVGTLLLGNDKNNVIVNYLLIRFCVEAFRTKWLSKELSKVKDK